MYLQNIYNKSVISLIIRKKATRSIFPPGAHTSTPPAGSHGGGGVKRALAGGGSARTSPRPAGPAPAAAPASPRAAPVCPLLLNVLLADTVLNVFRDHNFDSCTLCVCNAGARVRKHDNVDPNSFLFEFVTNVHFEV